MPIIKLSDVIIGEEDPIPQGFQFAYYDDKSLVCYPRELAEIIQHAMNDLKIFKLDSWHEILNPDCHICKKGM